MDEINSGDIAAATVESEGSDDLDAKASAILKEAGRRLGDDDEELLERMPSLAGSWRRMGSAILEGETSKGKK